MRRLAASTIVLAVTTALLVGAPAEAGGPDDPLGGEETLGQKAGLKYLSETLDVGSSGHYGEPYEAAWIACGSHSSSWHPASGGGKVDAPSSSTSIQVLQPADLDNPFESPDNTTPDDWWDTLVRSVVGQPLTGYAVCTKAKLRYKRVTTPDSPGPARTGLAKCPGDRSLVGGGAFIATSDSWINASYPASRQKWKSRVLDMVGGTGGMATYAVCRSKGDVKRVSDKTDDVAAAEQGSAVARCAGDRHVIGGGGKVSGSIGAGRLVATFPIDGSDQDSVPDDGWKVVGYNSSGADKSVTAYALCVKKT